MQQRKQRPFLKSLRGKILWRMLAVSLIPIAIVGGLMYNSMSSSEQSVNDSLDESREALQTDTIGNTKATLAWTFSMEMELWIAERIRDVEKWADNTAVIEAARNSKDAGGAAELFLLDEVGTSPSFDNSYITNTSGDIVLQLKSIVEQEETDYPTWVSGLNKGLHVSDIYPGAGIGTYPYYIDIAVKIEDITEGTDLGVLIGTVQINPVNFAQEYGAKVGTKGEQGKLGDRLMVWNRDGLIVADSFDTERYLEKTPTWSEIEQKVLDGMPNNTEIISKSSIVTDDFVAGYARSSNASVTIQFDDFPGLGWLVMVEQSADEALASLNSLEEVKDDLNDSTNSMLYTLIGILIGLVILVPALSALLSRGITSPIAQLRNAAERISMGDISVNIDVESEDEIGDLAESFERMVMAVRFLSQEEE